MHPIFAAWPNSGCCTHRSALTFFFFWSIIVHGALSVAIVGHCRDVEII